MEPLTAFLYAGKGKDPAAMVATGSFNSSGLGAGVAEGAGAAFSDFSAA